MNRIKSVQFMDTKDNYNYIFDKEYVGKKVDVFIEC